MLARLVAWIEPFVQSLGGFGLAIVAFIDSASVPLPEVTDIGIVVLVAHHPSRWWYYALTSTIGSVAGCYTLYAVARRGGETFLRKRMKARHIESGLKAFRKYGLMTVVVPAILPPPMPFKIFILLAGVANVRPTTFIIAAIIGRGFRYGGEALLAYKYGDSAMAFITKNVATLSIWFAVVVAVGGVAVVLWRRRRAS